MNKPVARRVQRAFAAAAHSYDGAAGIQRQVVDELVGRLPAEANFATVLDLGCGTGYAFAQMAARYPAARLLGLDFAENMLRRAPAAPGLQKICANAVALPIADASADLLFSSLTYQWCPLGEALSEARRVLRPGATLAFSTLTSDTFHELRAAFAGLDDAPHVLPLLPPERIADAVTAEGFTDLALTRRCLVARFESVRALFDSIRQTGASEVSAHDAAHETAHGTARRRGLLGKRAWATIEARLQALADAEGRLPLSYDVVYVVARAPGGRT